MHRNILAFNLFHVKQILKQNTNKAGEIHEKKRPRNGQRICYGSPR